MDIKLQLAITTGNIEETEFLLNNGSQLEESEIMYASSDLDMQKYLIERFVNQNKTLWGKYFSDACNMNRPEIVEFLLNRPEVNYPETGSFMIYHQMEYCKHDKILFLLAKKYLQLEYKNFEYVFNIIIEKNLHEIIPMYLPFINDDYLQYFYDLWNHRLSRFNFSPGVRIKYSKTLEILEEYMYSPNGNKYSCLAKCI